MEVAGDSCQCSDPVRNTIAALIYWLIRLHDHSFCIDGTIAIDDFCASQSGSLKATRVLVDKLVPLDEMRRSSDMAALATFAEHHLYQTHRFGPVPPAVQNLLNLLTTFRVGRKLLLKSHPAHEDPMGESALFTQLYGLLMALKSRDIHQFRKGHTPVSQCHAKHRPGHH